MTSDTETLLAGPPVAMAPPAPRPRASSYLALRVVAVAVGLVAWEIVGRRVSPLLMAGPSAIALAGWDMLLSGDLARALMASGSSLLAGFLVATVVAIPLGLAMGWYRPMEAMLDTYVTALYATPLIALVPLIMLWFGVGFWSRAVIVAVMAVFPILINTQAGVKDVSADLIELGRAFCASERAMFTKFVLPASVPFIMSGLRLAVGRAIIGEVVAEFFTALTGLGAVIVTAANNFQTAKLFVPVVVLMLLSVAFTGLVRGLERRLAHWKGAE
jgi:NitT/TauT family transport system permease protein